VKNKKLLIKSYRELDVYQLGIKGAVRIFELTKLFPSEERFNLVDQIRRSTRGVCANIAEAWRKRRYKAAFISKLSDAETEAAETQVHAEIAFQCGYLTEQQFKEIDQYYDQIIGKIIRMIESADSWLIKKKDSENKRGAIFTNTPTPQHSDTPILRYSVSRCYLFIIYNLHQAPREKHE
jgi:four helix bundle protein